jgi:signal transduction histidine kinase/CheY-like chemotaxis protein
VEQTFQELFTKNNIQSVLGEQGDARYALTEMVEELIRPETQDVMRAFNEISTMSERIGFKKIISQEYIGMTTGWSRASIIPNAWDEKGRPTKGLYCTQTIANEKEKLDIQSNLINALVSTYQNVYMVDMNTSEAHAYRMSSAIELRYGRSFFGGVYEKNIELYINNEVLDEDKGLFEKISTIEKVKENLGNTEKISFTYRVPREGAIKYFQCILLKPSKHRNEFVIAFKDVDDEVHNQLAVQKTLQDAYDAAKAANNAKTDFLANMSHDIRTPMNAIIGMTAIAATHIDDKERVQDCLKKITTASKHLLSLINEVLDMSKIESGAIELEEDNFNLSDLIDNLLTMVRPQIDAHGHELSVNIKNVQHENVIGDSLRIQQLFVNLMSNSIKYTPDGGNIKLSITEKITENQKVGCFEAVFEDNGIGMSEEFTDKLFEPFSRARDERVGKVQGTGLGMAISRNIVNMMGGSIDVKSHIDEGTKITVTMFLKLQDVEEEHYEDFADLPVLVADDDEASMESACAMLDELGMKSKGVLSGAEAVRLVTDRHEKNDDFFAVILDWKMPGMDGMETTRAIRKAVGDDVPIIIISAYDWSDIEQEARMAGANEFISKPLFKSRLTHLFAKLTGKEEEVVNTEPLKELEKLDCTGYRVLLVEDNELNAEIATDILGMTGIAIDLATDGSEAVDMVRDRGNVSYDLILMDIQMPKMNGYDATRAIRNLGDDYCRTVPIIAMTANAFAEDVHAALSAGMNAHIAKPLDLKMLIQVIDRWVINLNCKIAQ